MKELFKKAIVPVLALSTLLPSLSFAAETCADATLKEAQRVFVLKWGEDAQDQSKIVSSKIKKIVTFGNGQVLFYISIALKDSGGDIKEHHLTRVDTVTCTVKDGDLIDSEGSKLKKLELSK